MSSSEIRLDTASEVDPEWDRYVLGHPEGSVFHLSAWRKIFQDLFGHECYFFSARNENGALTGILPAIRLKSLLFGDFLVSMPYLNYGGFLTDSHEQSIELLDALTKLCGELNVDHAEIREVAGDWCELPVRKDKVAMVLELPETTEELATSLGSKRRSQIRRSQREGPETRIGGIELLDGFYEVFAQNMRDLGTPVYPKAFFHAIALEFPERVRVVVLSINGEPGAAAFLIDSGSSLHIPWASCLRKFNSISLNMLLYWEVLSFAISSGYNEFDFGRSTIGSGPYKFKQQWGAVVKNLHWYYWLSSGSKPPQLNPDNSKYRLLINCWKRLPVPVANWLGPRIVKNLP